VGFIRFSEHSLLEIALSCPKIHSIVLTIRARFREINVMAQAASARQSEEVRDIMIELARTQLAAVTAALKFWGRWVESADKYAQKLGAELTRVSEGSGNSQEFAGRLTDFSREYLREMISLPNVAVDHFVGEIEKISKPVGKPVPGRTRKARAKA
jgi:hypothetical protein